MKNDNYGDIMELLVEAESDDPPELPDEDENSDDVDQDNDNADSVEQHPETEEQKEDESNDNPEVNPKADSDDNQETSDSEADQPAAAPKDEPAKPATNDPKPKPETVKPTANPTLKPESMPKQTDRAEGDRNGVRRKKLYIAFIEWCKDYNSKNTFGSVFDKDIFHVTYPFVPEDMRYFYRLANPILCVLSGNLTFFAVSELKKINSKNKHLNEFMIFAATEQDYRVFSNKDRRVYKAVDKNNDIVLKDVLGDTFDTYIQSMIKKGDILNGPIEESVEYEY